MKLCSTETIKMSRLLSRKCVWIELHLRFPWTLSGFFAVLLSPVLDGFDQLTIKLHCCPLTKKCCCRLISTTSRNSSPRKILETPRIEPGPLGCRACTLPLCYGDPPRDLKWFRERAFFYLVIPLGLHPL